MQPQSQHKGTSSAHHLLLAMSVNDTDSEKNPLLVVSADDPVVSWRDHVFSWVSLVWLLYVVCLVGYSVFGKRQSELAANFVWVLFMIEPLMLVPLFFAIQVVRVFGFGFDFRMKWSSFWKSVLLGIVIFVYVTMQKYGGRGR
jgi:hypothetical protein